MAIFPPELLQLSLVAQNELIRIAVLFIAQLKHSKY